MERNKRSQSSRMLKMAHPRRCEVKPLTELRAALEKVENDARSKITAAFTPEKLTSEIVQDLRAEDEYGPLKGLLSRSKLPCVDASSGANYAELLYLRHALHPQPYFVLDDSLVQTLEDVDIDPDVPVGLIAPPCWRCFIEFGSRRECGLKVSSSNAVNHTLEGAYLERGVSKTLGDGLFVLLTGSPDGTDSAGAAAAYPVFIRLTEYETPIQEALLSAIAGSSGEPMMALAQQNELEALMFLAKALLFIALPEAKKEPRNDRGAWESATRGITSPARKAKAARNGAGLIDYVLVSGESAPVLHKSAAGGRDSGPNKSLRLQLKLQGGACRGGLHRVALVREVSPSVGEDDWPRERKRPTLH